MVPGAIIGTTISTANAHDGPEEHKPGELPLVNNGPGPQVVYGEVKPDASNPNVKTGDSNNSEPTTDHSHKTELKQGEFQNTSGGIGSATVDTTAIQQQEQQQLQQTPEQQPPEPKKESIASSFWPWSNNNNKPPPEFKPYRLPTMEGDSRSYHDNLPPLVKAPAIDPDLVFKSVMTCYPAPSNFNIDIELRGQIRSAAGGDDLL